MAKQNSSNLDVTPSGSNTYTFPSVTDTLLGSKAPTLTSQALGSVTAGMYEYDGVNHYSTIDTTNGRGAVPVQQYFRLTATGSTISTIANYFGANSNISLVSGGHYEIEIWCHFLKTTAGTVVWTFTNTAAPTSQSLHYRMSPVTGIVAPAGTSSAGYLEGNQYNNTSATNALSATGSLTSAANHFAHFRMILFNNTGTSLKIQATCSAGTITPGIGSYYICRRLPAASTGTFAA